MLGEPDEAFYSALLDDDPQDLYDSAPCGYLSTLPDGTIVKANHTFFAWTGLHPDEVIGRRRFQDLLPVGDRIFYETHYAPLLRMQGAVREIAIELVLPDGSRLPVLANSVMKVDGEGEPQLVRTVVFDARERRAYEQELVEALRRAEASEARALALARTLQSTFLPPTTPVVPGLDIAGTYRPAGDGSEVGGDFYDVFPTGRGTWAVVLGDVSGKGAAAAVVTALVRYTVRGEVLHSSSPAEVLGLVHQAMVREHPERFCTAVLFELEVEPEGVAVTMAVGGHELPLHVADHRVAKVGATGSILGILPTARLTDVSFVLRPGEVLVSYTDGISEARDEGVFFGDDRAAEVVAELVGGDAAAIADGLAEAAVSFQHGNTRDDIAVVVLRVPGAPLIEPTRAP